MRTRETKKTVDERFFDELRQLLGRYDADISPTHRGGRCGLEFRIGNTGDNPPYWGETLMMFSADTIKNPSEMEV